MRRQTLLLLVSTVVLGGVSATFWTRLHEANELRDAAIARASQLEERLASERVDPDLPGGATVDSAVIGASTSGTPREQPERTGSITPAPSEVDNVERTLEPGSRYAMTPERRRAMVAQQRVELRRVFPDLEAALDLEPDLSDDLMSLLAEHSQRSQEDMPLIMEGEPLEWDPNNKPDWVRKMEEQQQRNDSEIADLLGPAKFREWATYRDSVDARRIVREFRSMIDGTPDSLQELQMPLLVDAIAQAQKQFAADSIYDPSTGLDRFARYNQRLREGAAPYLLPKQMARFDDMLDRQLETARARVEAQTEARSTP